MLLTLKVLNYRGLPAVEQIVVRLDRNSGTIGRAPDNDLVLQDPENFISRRHAEIIYEGGKYILSDTSLSGTVIDDGEPLKKRSAELRDGMRIIIGDYELGVGIGWATDDEPSLRDHYESDEQLTDIIMPKGQSSAGDSKRQGSFDDFEEPQSFDFSEDSADPFPAFEDEQPAATDPLSPLENKSPPVDRFDPPGANTASDAMAFPDDFNFEELLDNPSSPEPEPRVNPEAVPRQSSDDQTPLDDQFDFDLPDGSIEESLSHQDLTPEPVVGLGPKEPPLHTPAVAGDNRQADSLFNVLLDAMGIDEPHFVRAANEEDTVRLIGKMFSDLIEGLMILLRSRAELKNQFRASVTMIRPAENNPLKFSVSVPDALNALLKPGQRGYLKPLDAIRNGFDDLSTHQQATTAGIQASLAELFIKFDPERFEKQIAGGLFKNKDAKCWEAYSSGYEQLVREAINGFFGEAFVKAYEKQVQTLKSNYGEK